MFRAIVFFGLTTVAALGSETLDVLGNAEVDKFAAAFSVAGEDQEITADKETLVSLNRFSGNPVIEKAKAEFERAQKVEERFHKDFDGIDFI